MVHIGVDDTVHIGVDDTVHIGVDDTVHIGVDDTVHVCSDSIQFQPINHSHCQADRIYDFC